MSRLHYFGEDRALWSALTHLDIHFLQHARDSCANFQRVKLFVLELGKRAHLFNFGLLHRELRAHRLGVHRNAVLLDLMSR